MNNLELAVLCSAMTFLRLRWPNAVAMLGSLWEKLRIDKVINKKQLVFYILRDWRKNFIEMLICIIRSFVVELGMIWRSEKNFKNVIEVICKENGWKQLETTTGRGVARTKERGRSRDKEGKSMKMN